jgi:surface protein
MMLALVAMLAGTQVMAEDEAYAEYTSADGGTLTFYYDDLMGTRMCDERGILNGVNETPWWLYYTFEKVVFDSSFATALPKSTRSWFSSHPSLTIVGLENLNTSDVEDMSWMFSGCSGLVSIPLSTFHTDKVTTMCGMFNDCSSLTSLDLSSFNTSNVTDMQQLFMGCSNLQSIRLSKSFDTSKVTTMLSMFSGCSSLAYLNLTSFDLSSANLMNFMFDGCSSLTSIYVGDQWYIDDVEEADYMFDGCTSIVGEKGTTYDKSHKGKEYAHIDGLAGEPGYLSARPSGYAVLSIADGTLTFYNDGNMPESAYPLNIDDVPPDWQSYNGSIEKVVFDNSFATAEPVSMCFWFGDCKKLTEIEGLKNLNTSKVRFMNCMFSNCRLLTALDLSNFNTSNVTNMLMMFNGCSVLKSLNLSSFNTSNVTNMMSMFNGCSSLENLNLGSFDTGNVTDMMWMFQNCSKLGTIYVGDGWNTENVKFSYQMFFNCSLLTGEKETPYNNSHTDATYARIDEGPDSENPGYFTTAPQPTISTGIDNGLRDSVKGQRDSWYTIDGRKLSGKPSKKGVYINNGKKAIVD